MLDSPKKLILYSCPHSSLDRIILVMFAMKVKGNAASWVFSRFNEFIKAS